MFKQELIARKIVSTFGVDGEQDLMDASNSTKKLLETWESIPSRAFLGCYSAALHELRRLEEELNINDVQEQCLSKFNANDALKNLEQLEIGKARIESSDLKKLAWISYNPERNANYIDNLKLELSKGIIRSPLYGVPVGIKDIFDVEGFRSTWGSQSRKNTPPAESDGDLARALRKSGCVIVGKQHTAELAMSPTGFNDYYGQGQNPLHPDRISGGSSSGAAMSVAAGHVLLAFGSDTGGSVRLPAALCGLVGLKPTNGRFSMNGGMPLSVSLDCPGPIAKTVEMCGLGYLAMTGKWPRTANDFYLPWRYFDPEKSSVSFPEFSGVQYVSREVAELAQKLRSYLDSRGVQTRTVSEPDLTTESSLANVVLSVEALLAHGAYLAECPKLIGRQVRRRLLKGLYIDSNAYASAMLYRSYYLSEFLKKSFAGSRVLVLPVTPAAAPLVNETLTGTLKEVEEKFSELSSWTRAINYLGLPSITLPLGSDPDGLPLGLQLVGRPYDEEHLITIAQDIERGINNEF